MADSQCARVKISDAQVIGKSSDGITTAWIQDATGGTNVKTFTPMERIYNLKGVRINQLKRGINIVNGQKVMVK